MEEVTRNKRLAAVHSEGTACIGLVAGVLMESMESWTRLMDMGGGHWKGESATVFAETDRLLQAAADQAL